MEEKLHNMQPLLAFLILPFFYLIYGTIYGLQYQSLQLYPAFLLYVLILANQMMELIIKSRGQQSSVILIFLYVTVEMLNILIISYFGMHYSWLAAVFLVLYSLLVQINFMFRLYDLKWIPSIIYLALNFVILNGFACYLQAHFVSWQTLAVTVPYILPFFILTSQKWGVQMNGLVMSVIMLVSIAIFIFYYQSAIGQLSWMILLTIPVGLYFLKNRHLLARSAYTFSFGLIGIIAVLVSL